jgi:hypothetical protein
MQIFSVGGIHGFPEDPGLKAISCKITLKNKLPDHWQKLREFCPNRLVTK